MSKPSQRACRSTAVADLATLAGVRALAALADPNVPARQKRFQVLAELMRVRRACCHPQLVAPEIDVASAKLKAFLELVTPGVTLISRSGL